MKNRTAMAEHFAERGFKLGAEVGVCYGIYSELLYTAIPDLELIAVDNWDNAETRHRERKHTHSVEAQARERLAPYKPMIIKRNSTEAAKLIADGCLDFVYIDAAHDYANVKADIEAWAEKVRPGGIVSGDDYYEFPSGDGEVIPAVDEYVAKHGLELHTTDWDPDNPARDERQPNWYFVKP